MFDGFTLETVALPEAALRVRHGGSGPPLLLLHGHPRTHATWHRVAPRLAGRFTVVCPDLRGFGGSSKPEDAPDHRHSCKRAKARDLVHLMERLGFARFGVAGHDRGAYAAFRLAMDHPERVTRLAVLDAVPTLEALERCDARFARLWWHWFFYAQPEKPERAILADPDAWYDAGAQAATMDREAYDDFLEAIRDPATVHAMVEDYRAGLALDWRHDAADREAGRRLACPTLVGWSLRDDMELLYGDPLAVWSAWADDLRGVALDCGHHMAEEVPEALADALAGFFGEASRKA